MTGKPSTGTPSAGKLKQAWLTGVPWIVKGALLLFFIAPILQETWGDLKELTGIGGDDTFSLQETEAPASFTMLNAYNRSFRLLKRNSSPASDQVIAIGIPSGLFPVQSNLCMGRFFVASLLDHLFPTDSDLQQNQFPAVVAIDKYYSDKACQKGDEALATNALDNSISRVAKDHAIVVGLSSAFPDTGDRKLLQDTPSHTFPNGSPVLGGYVRLNQDPLRIPLRFDNLDHHDGFALTAANASANKAGLAGKLKSIYTGGLQLSLLPGQHFRRSAEHPFAYLQPEVQVKMADEYLCHTLDPQENEATSSMDHAKTTAWSTFLEERCGKAGDLRRTDERAKFQRDFKGKVIVIGSEDDKDTYAVLGERIPGYQLQAKYVAALLGGAYLREWPLLLQLFFSIFLMCIVERTFGIWGPRGSFRLAQLSDLVSNRTSRPGQRAGRYSALGFTMLILLSPFILSFLGLFFGWLPPFPLLALAITLAVLKIYVWLEKVNEEEEDKKRHAEQLEAST